MNGATLRKNLMLGLIIFVGSPALVPAQAEQAAPPHTISHRSACGSTRTKATQVCGSSKHSAPLDQSRRVSSE